jgi:hypothetical protein
MIMGCVCVNVETTENEKWRTMCVLAKAQNIG